MYKDYQFRYADLRLAITWLEECKDSITEDTSYKMEQSINNSLGYLKSYCNLIKLEEK